MQQAGRGSFRGRGAGFGRGGKGKTGGRSALHTGRFADGIWHCNCAPRLPASHFQVKKEGKNKGRWFWTCQQNDPKRCDFFLWDDDAKPREAAAVMNNSRSEPHRPDEVPEAWHAGRGTTMSSTNRSASTPEMRADSPTQSFRAENPATSRSAKRTATQARLDMDDDDNDDFHLSSADEEALAELANHTPVQTPHKARKTGVYATPSTAGERKSPRKLPWLKENATTPFFPTPATIDRRPSTPTTTLMTPKLSFNETVHDATPSKAPAANLVNPRTPSPTSPTTPDAPPTLAHPASPSPPARYRDALVNPADDEASLTTEVLALLAPLHLPPDRTARLRTILSTHDLRTHGITRGRDISRVALRAKDARIAELEARIAGLEAEREVDRGVIRKLRSAKAQGRGQIAGFGA